MATRPASTPAFISGDGFYKAQRRLFHRKEAFLLDSHPKKWRISCFLPSKGADISWMRADDGIGELGGWIIVEDEEEKKNNKKLGLQRLRDFPDVLRILKNVAVGASAALILAAFFHLSPSLRRFKIHFAVRSPERESLTSPEATMSPEREVKEKPEIFPEKSPPPPPPPPPIKTGISGAKRQFASLEADSTQKQALFDLGKLKIIEDNVKPDDLCTRREYARWLVKMNSLLERSPRHKVVISGLAGDIRLFDDIDMADQDFIFIQALAESGIIPSKLSEESTRVDREKINFSPESPLSRFDLVDWRAQLEHLCTPMEEEKMLRKNLGFIDLDSVKMNASQALFIDLLTEDKSIIRRVFGNSRRLQPYKPATKAQAVVALASGRMAMAIQTELSRREIEELTLSAQTEEIRREMISSGGIESAWEAKVNGEKAHCLEILKDYQSTLSSLEEEKLFSERQVTHHVKEWAALDCQRQLLVRLREDIDQLQAKLADARSELIIEREALVMESAEWQCRQDTAAEAKTVLEVEKEALRILRCWVEEEARKNQVRAKVLESAVQRWTWQGQVDANEDSRSDENSKHL